MHLNKIYNTHMYGNRKQHKIQIYYVNESIQVNMYIHMHRCAFILLYHRQHQ